MSTDKTRWRSHVGLPTSIIEEAANTAMKRGEKIPRANDSNIKPKIIYVSRNHSVKNDSFKSELYIPKRSTSHESVVHRDIVEIPLREKISIVKNKLETDQYGFKPISTPSVKSTPSIKESPESPPPLIAARTPPSSANSSPPPPPIPTSSPPPLDDLELPPPPSPVLNSLPPRPPSPTSSFEGNHINLTRQSKHEDEILRYLDQSIAKENIVISETSQTVDGNHLKGHNSSGQTEQDSYLITKWDGKKAKTVRAFIKPGTVEELRELFQKLEQKYGKTSAIERKKMRRILSKRKRGDITVQNYELFRNEELPLIKARLTKTDSNQSDISTATTKSTDSTLSERESSSSSKEMASGKPSVTQADLILPTNINTNTVTNGYNILSNSSNNDNTPITIESHSTQDLTSSSIDKSNRFKIANNNEPFKPVDELKGLDHAESTYLGQRLIGVTTNNIVNKGLTDSYSSVWSSSNDLNMSEKTAEENNEWYREEVTPVLSTYDTALQNDQRHSENISSEKNSVIDVDMESKLNEQDKPDGDTRVTTVLNTQIRKTSSASSSNSSDSTNDEINSTLNHVVEENHDFDEQENRPMSPKEKYDNLLSELKLQTSIRRNHVTGADSSKTHSRTSSAKFSYNSLDDSSGDEQSYDVQEAEKPKPKEQFDNLLSEFKTIFGKKADTVSLNSQGGKSDVAETNVTVFPSTVLKDSTVHNKVIETNLKSYSPRKDSVSSTDSKEFVPTPVKEPSQTPIESESLSSSVIKKHQTFSISSSDSDDEESVISGFKSIIDNNSQLGESVIERNNSFLKSISQRSSVVENTSLSSEVNQKNTQTKGAISNSDLKSYFENLLENPSNTNTDSVTKTEERKTEAVFKNPSPETQNFGSLNSVKSSQSETYNFTVNDTYLDSRKPSLFPEVSSEPPPADSTVLLAPNDDIPVSLFKSLVVDDIKDKEVTTKVSELKADDSDLEESEEWKLKRTSVLQEPKSESVSSKSDSENTSSSDSSDSEAKQNTQVETVTEQTETITDTMPVLSGHEDIIGSYDLSSLDLSNIGNVKRISSNRSDRSNRSVSSRNSHSIRSSSSSAGGSFSGGTRMGGELVMVEGSNGDVYVVEDVTDSNMAKQQETFSSRSSSSGSRMQSGGYHIGSTGNVRIDSKVDDATANQVISALYGLNGDNGGIVMRDVENNSIDQRSVSLRSSGSTSGSVNYGVISLPSSTSTIERDDNNVTQDVKEHETVTIHGVTEDNVALIEHRVQKTITKHKDVEEASQSVLSSADDELTVDTGSTDYSLVGYKQTSANYAQPILVTTQQVPIDLSNSAMRTYNTSAVMVPQDNTVISTYNLGNLTTPATSTLNYNSNSAFQAYHPMAAQTTNAITTISDKYVGTTTEYTIGGNNQVQQTQTNYVKSVEPTEASYEQVQSLLNDIDKPKQRDENVTTVSVKKDANKKHEEGKDNETNYYSKTTTTTTIIPPLEIDSVYGSKSSRTTSEESPRDDEGPMYRIIRASMSPTRPSSPKRRTIYHEVEPRRRSPSPKRSSLYYNIERPSRSDVFRSERWDDMWRRDAAISEPRLDNSTYNTYSKRDYDMYGDDRKVKVIKSYASTDGLNRRRMSSGFVSSDSESDRNVTRIKVRDHSYPTYNHRAKHGYESDDEIGRLYRIRNQHRTNEYEPYRSESVMSDDQLYRSSHLSTSYSPYRSNYRSSYGIREQRSPSPVFDRQYRIGHTRPSETYGSSNMKSSGFKASRLDSGYFEPEYTTRTYRMSPSKTHTQLSPTRNSTIINLKRNDSGVTSPTRSESFYKVVNVKTSDDTMRKSRRRKSRSPSNSSDSDDEGRRYRVSSSKSGVTSQIRENGTNHSDSKLFVQRRFSPTRMSRVKSVSQDPIFRARSPSPRSKHRTTVDVRREYTDKLSRSLSDIRHEPSDKSYVVYNTRSSERPKSPKRQEPEIFMTDKSYRMRSLSPSRADISYHSFANDLPNGYGPSHGLPNGDVRTHSSYERTEKSYKIDNEPQIVDSSESKDLKVVRGQILIKNKINTSKDEDDFDDNVNIFDNYFHLQKDNPLYQSDPDIYKSFEEETQKKQSLGDELNLNQDITFETVEKFAKKSESQKQAYKSRPKKQNLSELLLSKISKIDSKDIRQTIDVKHTNEEIFGDIEFINADGSSSGSNNTKNFDSVSENVDLTLRDGKAFVIITVVAERIIPIDYEFNVWRKSAAIVTRQIEIDLFANDQRRRLYKHVMETGPAGTTEDGVYVRRNSRTGEEEKVLNSMQTLKLFSEILDVADDDEGQGGYDVDEMSVKTRQQQGQGQLPANEEIDFLY